MSAPRDWPAWMPEPPDGYLVHEGWDDVDRAALLDWYADAKAADPDLMAARNLLCPPTPFRAPIDPVDFEDLKRRVFPLPTDPEVDDGA